MNVFVKALEAKLSQRSDAVRDALRQFKHRDEGAAAVLSVFMIIMMLVMAGLGIDTMRHEMRRAQLQNTLDSAVLAAARQDSTDKAKQVIIDYFDKTGRGDSLNAIGPDDVEITLNEANVTATADFTVRTYLMKLAGVDTLTAKASSSATTATPNLEIVLVLDTSGSMGRSVGSETRMEALQDAAKDFVGTILDNTVAGKASIAIVPFSTSVSPSQEMFEALYVNDTHDFSNCLYFGPNDYNTRALPTDAAAAAPGSTLEEIDQIIYTSRYGNDFENLDGWWRSCYPEEYFQIMPFSMDKGDLETKIDSFRTEGFTSGGLGVKWAAGMLDPSFAPVTTALVAADVMPNELDAVPASYDEPQNQKIIVVMSDGQNTTTRFFERDSDYRGPDSDLYEVRYWDDDNPSGAQWVTEFFVHDPSSFDSIGEATTPTGYDPTIAECLFDRETETVSVPAGEDLCDDMNDLFAFDDDDYERVDRYNRERVEGHDFVALRNITEPGRFMPDGVTPYTEFYRKRHTWEFMWGKISPRYFQTLTGSNEAYKEYNNNPGDITASQKDTNMQNICAQAKTNNNVKIYSIGFAITPGGNAETQLQDCSTNAASHYYLATNKTGLATAFASIAQDVLRLRLTE
ncbi:MAG: TadE/TadG family type IV pilus assembly protein [Pseudomonadota bacterium]